MFEDKSGRIMGFETNTNNTCNQLARVKSTHYAHTE